MLKIREFLIFCFVAQSSAEFILKNRLVHQLIGQECYYSDAFWNVYAHLHFTRCRTVTFLLLHTNEMHRLRLKDFTDGILKQFSGRSLNNYKNVRIYEKFLVKYHQSRNRPYFNIMLDNDPTIIKGNMTKLSLKTFLKFKELIADVNAYVILVWNEEILQRFLDQDYTTVIPKSRASYAIFFLSPQHVTDCEKIRDTLAQVLARFWYEYQVIDVIFQRPCICQNIFRYRPFYQVNSSFWGLVQTHRLEDISENLHFLLNWDKNFNEHPMKVSLFPRRPTSLNHFPQPLLNNPIYANNFTTTRGFGGQDGCILGEISKYYNFNAEITPVFDGTHFGRVLDNGTITGSLGDVVSHRVYLSGNGRFLIDYGTKKVEFTMPYGSDQICAITPKAQLVPQWKIIFDCFDLFSWILILISFVISTLTWFLLKWNKTQPKTICWEVLSIMMGVSIKLKPNLIQIIFLSTCLFFNIVILGSFQGALFQAFTADTYDKDIDTLKELDESGLLISTSLSKLLDEDGGTKVIQNLRQKLIYVGDDLGVIARKRDFASLDRKNDVELLLKTDYSSEAGTPLLHISSECVTSYFIAYIMAEGSPLITIFNHILIRLVESGLTEKWYKDVVYAATLEHLLGLPQHKGHQAFSIEDIQVAFYSLLVGYVTAFLVLLGELMYHEKRYLRAFTKI